MKPKLAAAFCGMLFICTTAFALWGRYPNDEPVKAENWPSAVVEALNSQQRVFGAGSWDAGWTFYFVGTTESLNAFLEIVSTAKDTELRLVLAPEPGVATPDPWKQEEEVKYEWSLHLYPIRNAYNTFFVPKKGETPEQFEKREKEERAKLPEFGVSVNARCTGRIVVEKLKIPMQMNASVGGRLANLVSLHNERRNGAIAEHQDLSQVEPTNESNYPRDAFGRPSDEDESDDKKLDSLKELIESTLE